MRKADCTAVFLPGSDSRVRVDYGDEGVVTLDLRCRVPGSSIFNTDHCSKLSGMTVFGVPGSRNNRIAAESRNIETRVVDSVDDEDLDPDKNDQGAKTIRLYDTVSMDILHVLYNVPPSRKVKHAWFNATGNVMVIMVSDEKPGGNAELDELIVVRKDDAQPKAISRIPGPFYYGKDWIPSVEDTIPISSNGNLLAWSDGKDGIHIWDICESRERFLIPQAGYLPSKSAHHGILLFSPDGAILVVGLFDMPTHTAVYSAVDSKTGKRLADLTLDYGGFGSGGADRPEYSPDGRLIAFGLYFLDGGSILLWDPRVQQNNWNPATLTDSYRACKIGPLKFSHDCQLLAACMYDQGEGLNSVHIWDVSTATLVSEILVPFRRQLLSFSDLGNRLDTNVGRLPWSRPGLNPITEEDFKEDSEDLRGDSRDCVFVHKGWVLHGPGYRLIWIPPRFLNNSADPFCFAIKDGRIFLMSERGDVSTFKVDLAKVPAIPSYGARIKWPTLRRRFYQ